MRYLILSLLLIGCNTGAPVGAACKVGDDCSTGFCRPIRACSTDGICIDPAAHTECEAPADWTACTCDGRSVMLAPGCPDERIQYFGECGQPGTGSPHPPISVPDAGP